MLPKNGPCHVVSVTFVYDASQISEFAKNFRFCIVFVMNSPPNVSRGRAELDRATKRVQELLRRCNDLILEMTSATDMDDQAFHRWTKLEENADVKNVKTKSEKEEGKAASS